MNLGSRVVVAIAALVCFSAGSTNLVSPSGTPIVWTGTEAVAYFISPDFAALRNGEGRAVVKEAFDLWRSAGTPSLPAMVEGQASGDLKLQKYAQLATLGRPRSITYLYDNADVLAKATHKRPADVHGATIPWAP
jgi:hypothetical protein